MPLVLTAETNPGTASFTDSAGTLILAGKANATTQPVIVVAAGVAPTDIVTATVETDDGAASLEGVAEARPTGSGIAITFNVAPSGLDGVVSYTVIRPG